jgi:hypothetical protein
MLHKDTPICFLSECLNFEHVYCTTDFHNITPNSVECSRYVVCENHKNLLININTNTVRKI